MGGWLPHAPFQEMPQPSSQGREFVFALFCLHNLPLIFYSGQGAHSVLPFFIFGILLAKPTFFQKENLRKCKQNEWKKQAPILKDCLGPSWKGAWGGQLPIFAPPRIGKDWELAPPMLLSRRGPNNLSKWVQLFFIHFACIFEDFFLKTNWAWPGGCQKWKKDGHHGLPGQNKK